MHSLLISSPHGLAHTGKLWLHFKKETLPEDRKLVSFRAWSTNSMHINNVWTLTIMPIFYREIILSDLRAKTRKDRTPNYI